MFFTNENGPAEAYKPQQERFSGEFCKNKQLSFFKAIKSISLKSFFSSFFDKAIAKPASEPAKLAGATVTIACTVSIFYHLHKRSTIRPTQGGVV